ncbi:hypothetical protein MG293_016064 [Ovis ammon polii]|uniref:Uncharacterized protein n=1 Tax=Ovis ammon polii TaxID=230172 RepID=A0AAD4TWR9_OVIAM|nr:hypothetical protein MG293_016064 [Ovis ammon polii]
MDECGGGGGEKKNQGAKRKRRKGLPVPIQSPVQSFSSMNTFLILRPWLEEAQKPSLLVAFQGLAEQRRLLGPTRGSDLRERNSSSKSSSFSDGSSSRKNEPEARERETSNSYSDLETAIYGLACKTLTQSQCSKTESPGSFMHVCTSKSQGNILGMRDVADLYIELQP